VLTTGDGGCGGDLEEFIVVVDVDDVYYDVVIIHC